ncbi:EamA family transporter [Alicyclobacillus tolerans]|uniref:EamA family transporter n=1 Tax=Alicyclobacillus tolerans TaxID=90970 RepID=UPI001F015459|nr:EamA family transporter [Alicyclobacillus tolerans]MCF8567108.1 EamA family transporter [Alicyclobacillus tolerans]
MNYLLIFINIVLLVSGQTLWKIGIAHVQIKGLKSVLLAMFSPWVIAGIVLYVIATVVWIYLLSKMPLSLLYPLQSLAYVMAVVVAIFVFKEQVSILRWVGVAVILLGAALVVK